MHCGPPLPSSSPPNRVGAVYAIRVPPSLVNVFAPLGGGPALMSVRKPAMVVRGLTVTGSTPHRIRLPPRPTAGAFGLTAYDLLAGGSGRDGTGRPARHVQDPGHEATRRSAGDRRSIRLLSN